jgi:hypothetical protein
MTNEQFLDKVARIIKETLAQVEDIPMNVTLTGYEFGDDNNDTLTEYEFINK